MKDIPEAVLVDCAQLVKANSIQGTKEGAVLREEVGWEEGDHCLVFVQAVR